jgi:hypothetical protein
MNLRSDTLVAKNPAGEDVFIPTLFWPSARAFLEDWGRPLDDLRTEDVSRHGDEIKHRLQMGLRAIVRHSAVICGLPALEASGEALVARLDAILGASGKVGLPAAFYAPLFCLREWLRTRARPESKLLPAAVSDAEWDAYVKRIGSGE